MTNHTPQTKEQLRAELMNVAKKNSVCINRRLSATEYQSEVWPLANNAVDEIVAIFATHLQAVREAVEAEMPRPDEYGRVDGKAGNKLEQAWDSGWNEALAQCKAALDKGFGE